MKTYIITEEMKNSFSSYLKSVIVPSTVGANLIQIATALDTLPEVEEPRKETD